MYKKIILSMLCCGGLLACNNGGGQKNQSQNTLYQNRLNSINIQSPHEVGIVITNNHAKIDSHDVNNLNWYEDGKFIKSLWHFEDKPTSVSFNGTSVYVTTDDNTLVKCDFDSNNFFGCKIIDRFASTPVGVSFDIYGNGFVVTKDGNLNQYIHNEFQKTIHNFDDEPTSVSFAENKIYVTTRGKELKQCDLDGNCRTMDSFGSIPQGASFDNNRTGFVVTDDKNLDKYINDDFSQGGIIHKFSDKPLAVSYTDGDVYIATEGKELKKCSTDGNCTTLDSFFAPVVAVSFHKSTITQISRIYQDSPVNSISTTTNGYIYATTVDGRLLKCSAMLDTQCQIIDSFFAHAQSIRSKQNISFSLNGNGFINSLNGVRHYNENRFSNMLSQKMGLGISYTGSNLYALSRNNDELLKCDSNGENCKTINQPSKFRNLDGLSFGSNGMGFVISSYHRHDHSSPRLHEDYSAHLDVYIDDILNKSIKIQGVDRFSHFSEIDYNPQNGDSNHLYLISNNKLLQCSLNDISNAKDLDTIQCNQIRELNKTCTSSDSCPETGAYGVAHIDNNLYTLEYGQPILIPLVR